MRALTARRVTWVLLGVLAFYLLVVGQRGWLLVRDGRPAFVLLGAGVLVLPVVGAWVVAREVRFGFAAERLARAAGPAAAGPAGTPDFAARRADVEAAPADWRAWFRLAEAYDAAGDRPRARRALRHAIALHDAAPHADAS